MNVKVKVHIKNNIILYYIEDDETNRNKIIFLSTSGSGHKLTYC